MDESGESTRKDETLHERIHALSAAILRISENLDLETVLHEVLEGARALTGARYGVISTVDSDGQPEDLITSGLTEEEHQNLMKWSDRPRVLEHLQDIRSTLRLADFNAYVRKLGYYADEVPYENMHVTPMGNRGAHIGIFIVGGKAGGKAFTDEDDELLLLFAAQAANAIYNARAHRNEQRARANLEALVETSPVGVVVFDAVTGEPLSLNREAMRLISVLRRPDLSLEQILELLTCRKSDGRELSLDELRSAQTVRAEEVVLSVPAGGSVTLIINATPIRSENGATVSVVVTMQDLAPIKEMERLRIEFLSMVSQELRAPLASIKGSATAALGTSPALNPVETHQFLRIIDEQADHMRSLIGDLLDAGRIASGTLSVAPAPVQVAELVEQARNAFLSGDGGHPIVIDLPPDLPRVMADRQRILQVLNNLLSNAAEHSPESSPVRVAAARDGIHVRISVSGEGKSILADPLPDLFRKHAGDRQHAAAGHRLGLAICKGLVEAHGGRIQAESGEAGQGMRFSFTVPTMEASHDDPSTGALPSGSRSSGEGQEQARILVVDGDPAALRYVRNVLDGAGYATQVTHNCGELSDLVSATRPHLLLLDLIWPGTDGIELMESVPELASLPVIFTSGYGRKETIARALETGAVDYIVKPFSPAELTARVAAALRKHAGSGSFRLKDLVIDFERQRATVAGRTVALTATEYDLLRVLSTNAGRVVTFDALFRHVWADQGSGNLALVRTLVKNLRRKLGDHVGQPAYILTARGVGYRMPKPGDPA